MEKSSTILAQTIKNRPLLPRKHTIENILNYSKSMEVISTQIGMIIVVNN
jgi:hypothetical protein